MVTDFDALSPGAVSADRERLLVELVDRAGQAIGTCPVREAHTGDSGPEEAQS